MSNDKWNQLLKCPKQRFSNIISINSDEFVLSPYNYTKQKSDGLIKYTISTNKWSTFLKYPRSYEVNNSTLSYDSSSSKLYLIGQQKILSSINLDKNKFIDNIGGEYETGVNPSSLFVDGSLHIIGGSRNNKHIKRNIHHIDNDNDDNKNNQYHQINEFTDWVKGIQSAGFIHIPSKKLLVLIGGYCQHNPIKFSDMVWTYDLTANSANAQWKKQAKLPARLAFFGCVLSNDEKYIVVIGGLTAAKKPSKKIYALDTDTMKFVKTNISAPCSGSIRAVITDNNDIHLFSHDNGNQWKINIKLVIQSYNDNNTNFYYDIVKKYKKLLQDAEIQNRKLQIALQKQKQKNDAAATSSSNNSSSKNSGNDAMTKKMKKTFANLEQKNKELIAENRKLQNANSKLQIDKDKTQQDLQTFKNKNMAKANQIKDLNQQVKDLNVKAKELDMIKKLIEKEENDDEYDNLPYDPDDSDDD